MRLLLEQLVEPTEGSEYGGDESRPRSAWSAPVPGSGWWSGLIRAEFRSDTADRPKSWGASRSRIDVALREELARNRAEAGRQAQDGRAESAQNLNAFTTAILGRMTEVSTLQKNQLDSFSRQLSSLDAIE